MVVVVVVSVQMADIDILVMEERLVGDALMAGEGGMCLKPSFWMMNPGTVASTLHLSGVPRIAAPRRCVLLDVSMQVTFISDSVNDFWIWHCASGLMELVELRARFIMNKFSIATNLAAHLGCDMPHRAVCSRHAGVGTHIRHIFVPHMSGNSRGSRIVVVFVVKMAYWQDFSNLISCAGTLGDCCTPGPVPRSSSSPSHLHDQYQALQRDNGPVGPQLPRDGVQCFPSVPFQVPNIFADNLQTCFVHRDHETDMYTQLRKTQI